MALGTPDAPEGKKLEKLIDLSSVITLEQFLALKEDPEILFRES